jgi:CRP/FNR family transcriptional regulator, cyclic AMP receptor protein
MAALAAEMPVAHYPPRHTFYAAGEPGQHLYFIVGGKVKLVHCSAEGREQLVALLGPSDIFGALSTLDPSPRTATAVTLTEADVVSIDREQLLARISDRPRIAEQLLRILAQRLRRTNDDVVDLMAIDVPGRVARQLLSMAQRFGVWEVCGLRVAHDLTQREFALLVGAGREAVNRSLADFVHRGWIQLEGKSVLILDPQRLRRRGR